MSRATSHPGQGVGGGRPPLTPGELKVNLVASVTQQQRAKVHDLAAKNKMSVSGFIRFLIEEYRSSGRT